MRFPTFNYVRIVPAVAGRVINEAKTFWCTVVGKVHLRMWVIVACVAAVFCGDT